MITTLPIREDNFTISPLVFGNLISGALLPTGGWAKIAVVNIINKKKKRNFFTLRFFKGIIYKYALLIYIADFEQNVIIENFK